MPQFTRATERLTVVRSPMPAGIARLELRNRGTGAFDPVSQCAVGRADELELIENINASNYVINSSNIDISVSPALNKGKPE